MASAGAQLQSASSQHAHLIETQTSNSLLHMVDVIWQVLMPNTGGQLEDAGVDTSWVRQGHRS